MRILAVQNESYEHLGLIEAALRKAGIAHDRIDLSKEPRRRAAAESYDGLIVMGGPASANDDTPAVRAALDIVARALGAGLPALGICLGAQMIAKSLGARVFRNPVKEIGWAPVYWTENAASDPLFRGLTEPETVFHWHGETFDLPDGAVWLARSDRCRHQAFRLGTNVYGLQFHLEVTPEMIADWLMQDANCADLRDVVEPIDPSANAARLAVLSGLVFGRWCGLVARRAGVRA